MVGYRRGRVEIGQPMNYLPPRSESRMKVTVNHRRFHLQRDTDVTGTSGTGERVAEGCLFSNGVAVVEWVSENPSTNRYSNIQAVMQVHGHGGATKLVWDDEDRLGV